MRQHDKTKCYMEYPVSLNNPISHADAPNSQSHSIFKIRTLC